MFLIADDVFCCFVRQNPWVPTPHRVVCRNFQRIQETSYKPYPHLPFVPHIIWNQWSMLPDILRHPLVNKHSNGKSPYSKKITTHP